MLAPEDILYALSRRWPSPMRRFTENFGAEPGSDQYEVAYTQEQFDRMVRSGIRVAVSDKDVLEIGCGHGGISCYLAVAGARSVVGIDLNEKSLAFAERFAERVSRRVSGRIPVRFVQMDAYNLGFEAESFDVVFADNAFEHFEDPARVLGESFRVLRPGGRLVAPTFSSILSKHGLHLKHGLKVPWSNLAFSEPTIIRALKRLAEDDPNLFEVYPGLRNDPERVRDLRRHRDLNDITYSNFQAMALKAGFEIEKLRPFGYLALAAHRVPVIRNTRVVDVLSSGASAILRKPA